MFINPINTYGKLITGILKAIAILVAVLLFGYVVFHLRAYGAVKAKNEILVDVLKENERVRLELADISEEQSFRNRELSDTVSELRRQVLLERVDSGELGNCPRDCLILIDAPESL